MVCRAVQLGIGSCLLDWLEARHMIYLRMGLGC
jgi:hypothetical protein